MRYHIVVSEAADHDLLRLADFLAERSERAARKASTTLKKAIRSLDRMPMRARTISGSMHVLDVPFGESGYAIWFRVDADTVTIARIFHMREKRA